MRFLHTVKIAFYMLLMSMATTVAMASPYVVEGFRSAKFGMTKNQVITSIKNDFDLQDAEIKRDVNLEDGTDLLVVKQPSLSVFANPTTISYVFGHKNKKLIVVKVEIIENSKSTTAQQNFLRTAIEKLVPFFVDNDLSEYKVISNVALEQENAVVLFGLLPQSDAYPQALEIALSNVSVQQKDKQVFVDVQKDSKDPVVLRLSYVASLKDMDTFANTKINKKDF